MAKIKNDNIGTPGTTTNAVSANAKFTDIQTATTTSLSRLNIKAQGVDLPNISSTGLVQDFRTYHNGTTTRPWALVNAGTTATPIIDPGVPANIAQIAYGAGITLVAGDVLRIQFTVGLESHNAGGAGTTLPDLQDTQFPIAFVMWDITSNALANFVPLPGRASLGAAEAVGNDIIIDNHDGAQANYMTDGVALFSYRCAPVTGATANTKQVSQGMLVYQRPIPSPNQTVYGVRLFLRGRMLYKSTGASGHRVFEVGAGGNITHNIDYVHLTAMQMRHGTVN